MPHAFGMAAAAHDTLRLALHLRLDDITDSVCASAYATNFATAPSSTTARFMTQLTATLAGHCRPAPLLPDLLLDWYFLGSREKDARLQVRRTLRATASGPAAV